MMFAMVEHGRIAYWIRQSRFFIFASIGAASISAQEELSGPAAPAPEVIAAWEKAGAEFGWIAVDPWARQSWRMGIGVPPDASGPYFALDDRATAKLKSLPAPNVPFGIRLSGRQVTDLAIGELSAFDQLRVLELSETKNVTGAGLKQLSGSAQLRSLNLLYIGGLAPQPTELTPQDLATLTQLRSLSILVKQGDLAALPPELRSLHVAGQLTEARLKELSELRQLRFLTLTDRRFSGTGLTHLVGLKQLQALSLQCELRSGGITELATLKQLKRLRLETDTVSDVGLKELSRLNGLQFLDLMVFSASGTDAALGELAALTELRWLGLSGRRVSDDALKAVSRLENVATIQVFNSRVTDAGLKYFVSMPSLQTLILARCQVTDAGLRELGRLAKLRSLNLSETQVTDAGLNELKGLRQLRSLEVSRTRVTEAGARRLEKTLPDLRVRGYATALGH